MKEVKTFKEVIADYNPKEGVWDDVIQRHFEYLKFYPKNAVAYYNLGFAFAQRGQKYNAEVAFNKALAEQPNMAEAIVNLGGLAFGRCEWDKCIEFNKKAIKIQPALTNAKTNIAYALFMKGEHNQAVEAFEKLIEDDAKHGGAIYGLANVYYELDNLELSRKYLAQAVSLGVEPEPQFLEKLEESERNKNS